MAEENKPQESLQEQGENPVQEPAEKPQAEPAQKKGGGLLMPILYALLAAAGAFTLVMIIGIVVSFLTRPARSPEYPSAQPSAQVVQTQSPQAPDSESPDSGDASQSAAAST